MEEFNLLPIYRQGFGEICEGIEIKVPLYCKDKCNSSKCEEYYKKISNGEEGIYTCPYGFNSILVKDKNQEDSFIFTSLRIAGKYDKSKVMPKVKNESKDNREISIEKLYTYVDAYKKYYDNEVKYNIFEQFVTSIFHDIRQYNSQIKMKNDRLYSKSQSGKKQGDYLEIAKSISVLSWFLTLRMNSYDFCYCESLVKTETKTDWNLYRIFDKIKKCVNERLESKYLKLNLIAYRDCRNIKAYDCIELLPFILIDNAIKYAPNSSEISVNIEEKGSKQFIKVTSWGPQMLEEEYGMVFNRGFRGQNALESHVDGMGIGLYTAKKICDLHEIKIRAESKKTIKKTIKDVNYSEFSVDIEFEM